VKRNFQTFSVTNFTQLKQQMLNWCNQFNICAFLDNHQYHLPQQTYECLIGCGSVASVNAQAGSAFDELQLFINEHNDWRFGHFGYDLKNETEQLRSNHPDRIGFPDLFFFIPQYVIQLSETEVSIGSFKNDQKKLLNEISAFPVCAKNKTESLVEIKERVSRTEYIESIEKIRSHILRGDCYELNYCMEFFAEDVLIDPVATYELLAKISPNPFASFYKINDSCLLCASPERFLKKTGRQLISQPIKGTERRNLQNMPADEELKQALQSNPKERSENVMVVDLVRNDLSRVCEEGTVQVDELFGIYSFPQVHQMISTISGTSKEGMNFSDIIKATFPMGSMTGAPKRKVMELIEQYECSRRGLFSGAVGYISPNGDFDFNVVIRSILYNALNRYLSYSVGSGITWYSDAEKEYEECMVKASAIQSLLRG
jgi:para-aminobenzoate synthetase component I